MITSRHTLSARAASFFSSLLLAIAVGTVAAPPVFAGTVAQVPLFLVNSAKPLVMLDMSKDHQLFYKAYDDYSDLTGDGTPETTYRHSVDYYGYFDSYKCYTYTNNRFEPLSTNTTKYCSGQWSGNFLNWASMARIDTVRKILYGGYRSTDSSSDTVLERTYLPNDAHSFAKYYNGSDIGQLAPFGTQTAGITLCNTTLNTANAYSQTVGDPPLIRVAKGNYSLWAANERWQCRWNEEQRNTGSGFGIAGSNGNEFAISGINAANDNPVKATVGLGQKDYFARVQVCKPAFIGTEDCKQYPTVGSSPKPIGLLQTYGDSDQLYFGLMTGSYKYNKSGGALRKNIGSMTDEVNVTTDGTFKVPVPTGGGIVNTLNKLRMYGYSHNDGTYDPGDKCTFNRSSFPNGECTNWGNPQSEIYLESLRYLCGKNPTPGFNAIDTGFISGLATASWNDPLSDLNYCAPLTIIDFNASVSSYDDDELLSGTSDLNTNKTADALTNDVGNGEGITGKSYFVGRNGTNNDQLCTSKTVPGLGTVDGTCPQAPRLLGTYDIAGLAYHAHVHDLRSNLQGDQKVTTYGVALSPAVPQVSIPVPGSTKTVTILPACRNIGDGPPGAIVGNCAIVDFKIVQPHTVTSGVGKGKFFVNWESSEQGSDYDQDMPGVLEYEVTSTTIKVKTLPFAATTAKKMGFGYTISGTTKDGFHAHSGIKGFNYTDPTGAKGCTNCQASVNLADSTSYTYTLGASSAGTLQQPLWYASKWGGFTVDTRVTGDDKPDLAKKWDTNADGIPDNYFYATDPAQLARSLAQVFLTVQQTTTSAASVATNSVTYQTGTRIYQGQFDSSNWSGDLLSYGINSDGSVATSPSWSAASILATTSAGSRQIVTYDPSAPGTTKGVPFLWDNLNATQKGYLDTDPVNATPDTKGQDRLDYLRGDHSKEQVNGGTFRNRTDDKGTPFVLGDIVHSKPSFVGPPVFIYPDSLEDVDYSSYKQGDAKNRTPMLYVGANDGMLHGFNASTGAEVFAYVPNEVFPKLNQLTKPAYAHAYYADGVPTVGDVFYDGAWHTVLVGSLGGGGGSYFALNVTSPEGFTSETTVASNVLWEITAATTGFSDLGATFSNPAIVRMHNDKWAAVFGNGFNSTSGKAVLYIVDIETGALLRSFDTTVGPDAVLPNGLATPAPVDVDGDWTVDYIYAGDLKGNMWKFAVTTPDLSTRSDPANWGIAFGDATSPLPLYKAQDDAGIPQPITTGPQIGRHSDGEDGLILYFGTGKYFETGDGNPVGATTQSFYGVWDKFDGTRGASRTDLLEQEVLGETTQNGYALRITSKHSIDYTSQQGWYMDLPAQGERQVSESVIDSGRIIFATLYPSTHRCDFGGTSWLMELDPRDGGRLDEAAFDLNGDGKFTDMDLIQTYDSNGDGTVDSADKVPPSGKQSKIGIVNTPTIISAGDKKYKYTSGSKNAQIEVTVESNPSAGGRQSWRQLQ